MNTCPICGVEVEKIKLLPHVWQHLRLEGETESITRGRRAPSQTRVCWCGQSYYAFIFWMEHMAGKDVQAHYASSVLGINHGGYRNVGERP